MLIGKGIVANLSWSNRDIAKIKQENYQKVRTVPAIPGQLAAMEGGSNWNNLTHVPNAQIMVYVHVVGCNSYRPSLEEVRSQSDNRETAGSQEGSGIPQGTTFSGD